MDQAYLDLAIYVVDYMLKCPDIDLDSIEEYSSRLMTLCADYHKDDKWDAHLKAWNLTDVVAHGLPLTQETEMKLQYTLRVSGDAIAAGHRMARCNRCDSCIRACSVDLMHQVALQ